MTDIVDELRARALQGRFNLEAADEIERLRAELSEQCRLLGMSGEREAKHLAQIAALEKERDALRAELDALKAWKEEAEKQEPTRDWWDCLIADISAIDCMYRGSPTYAHDAYWMRDHVVWMLKKRRDALPGAKGEEK